MLAKFKEYPESAEMLELAQRLKTRLDFLDQIQSQIDTRPEPKVVENASNTGINGEGKGNTYPSRRPAPP